MRSISPLVTFTLVVVSGCGSPEVSATDDVQNVRDALPSDVREASTADLTDTPTTEDDAAVRDDGVLVDVAAEMSPDASADVGDGGLGDDRTDVGVDAPIDTAADALDAATDTADASDSQGDGFADAPAPFDAASDLAGDLQARDAAPEAGGDTAVDATIDTALDGSEVVEIVDVAPDLPGDVPADLMSARDALTLDAPSDVVVESGMDGGGDTASCATLPSLCDPHAVCVTGATSARCVCRCGYSGDGTRCVDDYPNVLFVAREGRGDGSCWSEALPNVQAALAAASPGTEIWVKATAYIPGTTRADTFRLRSGVALYGGFVGDEVRRDQRDPVRNVTTLSGDILGDDNRAGYSDNAYHVVDASGVDGTCILDGFTVQSGIADGTGINRRGAGLYVAAGAPHIINCRFTTLYGSDSNIELSGPGALLENITILGLPGSTPYVNITSGSATFRSLTLTGAGSSAIAIAGGASLTVEGGRFTHGAGTPHGRAIQSIGGSAISVRDATFSGYARAILANGASITLDRCTFTDNFGGPSDEEGSAVVSYNGPVRVAASTFRNNVASRGPGGTLVPGGAILVSGAATTVDGCTFENNRGAVSAAIRSGGALRISNSTFRQHVGASSSVVRGESSTEVRDCEFTDNTGPALYAYGSLDVSDSTFARNVPVLPEGMGGAIYVPSGHATVLRSVFNGNSTAGSGGAISVHGTFSSTPVRVDVVGCRFIANRAAGGGTLQLGGSGPTVPGIFNVSDCEFIDNRADLRGGGIEAAYGQLFVNACTFFNNDGATGAIFGATLLPRTSITATNSVFWTDGVSDIIPGFVTATWCAANGLTAGTGNVALVASPFAYSLGADGVRGTADDAAPLSATSPCVDVGSAAELPSDVLDIDGDGNTSETLPLDVQGGPRVRGAGLDMGARER